MLDVRTLTVRLVAVLALVVAMAVPASAQLFAGKQFVVISDHDPLRFSTALRAADDFLGDQGTAFRIILNGRGVLLAIPGTTNVQKEYVAIKRKRPGLTVVVCKEVADALQKANKRKVPYLPGVQITPCANLRVQLERDGYQRAMGF